MSLSRVEIDLIGNPSAPVSRPASSFIAASMDLTATAGVFESVIGGQVIVGSSPSASPTVLFYYSLDGGTYVPDGGALVIPTTASTTTPFGPYVPPAAAKRAQVSVTNNDTGSVSITCWAQGTVLASSVL